MYHEAPCLSLYRTSMAALAPDLLEEMCTSLVQWTAFAAVRQTSSLLYLPQAALLVLSPSGTAHQSVVYNKASTRTVARVAWVRYTLLKQPKQVQNWQTAPSSCATPNSSQEHGGKPDKLVLTLTITAAEELPAAEAVIAGLYGVDGAFTDLQHEQLVKALIIADMIDATETAEQASQKLRTAAASQQGLSTAALRAMAGLAAWPECLLQLLPVLVANASCFKEAISDLAAVLAVEANKVMQRLLVSVFGDLQAVWRDERLTDMLLQLPCPALQLLFSSDDLQVPSEDIVLYTAQQYVNKQQSEEGKVAARSALAGLVRAPHLSDVMLHYVVLSDDSEKLLLMAFLQQLKQLLLMRRSQESQTCYTLLEAIRATQGAPDSWQLGQRQNVPAVSAKFSWKLPVQQLKQACQKAFADKTVQKFYSPTTPPVAGFACGMLLECQALDDGVLIGVYVGVKVVSANFFCDLKFRINSCGRRLACSIGRLRSSLYRGWKDFLDVGVLPGGWDEAALAAKKLPISGDLVLELEVLSVS